MKDLELKYIGTETNIKDFIGMIQAENQRQLDKWGIQDRTPFEWIAYIAEKFGEVVTAVCEHEYRGADVRHIQKENIQLMTLCLKLLEMYYWPEYSKEG